MSVDTAAGSHRGLPHRHVRVLVVDDHPLVRRGLAEVLNEAPGLAVCGEAGTTTEALAAAAAAQPDVAIVDLTLGTDSGLDLVSGLRAAHPGLRVLMLSAHEEWLYAERALKAGALGYLMKDRGATELIAAVRRVAEGKPYVSQETAERILSALGAPTPAAGSPSLVERLSDRERHVLMLAGRGMSTREIAGQLDLSVKTVESHYAHIKAKLGLRNGRELLRVAVSLVEGYTR
jgi:DNA-binding NarL/FixJ family response regulator